MVRRVKAYLKNMKVITDEEKLLAMSMECEPPSGGIQIAQPSLRKRNPSPTPSAVSSTSSGLSEKKINNNTHGGSASSLHPPKFGAASPQAVKKLLALSETSKARPKAILPSTPSPLSKGHVPHSSNASAHQGQHHHHSLTNSVDLTAESSSVTSLPSTRKAQANNSGSVTSNDSGVGFYNDNHNAELAPPLPRHHSRTQRPLPPQGSSRHRLKVPSPRVAVHHALPEGIMHRTRNADHSILINNRLVLAPSSTSKPPPSLLRKNVFYHPDEDDETQVSAV